jgi:hypothetical protein
MLIKARSVIHHNMASTAPTKAFSNLKQRNGSLVSKLKKSHS